MSRQIKESKTLKPSKTGTNPIKVMVSVLALMAAAPFQSARAQLSITCTQVMNFGAVLVPANAGNMVITPSSAFSATGGLSVISNPHPGKCYIKTLAATAAPSVVVSIGVKRTDITNATGGKIRVTNFNLKTPSGGRTVTYSSVSLANGFIVGIGAEGQYSKNESRGSYSGTITITATTP